MATMLGLPDTAHAFNARSLELPERLYTEHSDRAMFVFSGNSNRHLAEEIAGCLGLPLGNAMVTTFKNEETRVRIEENVRGADVFVIQSTHSPVDHHIM